MTRPRWIQLGCVTLAAAAVALAASLQTPINDQRERLELVPGESVATSTHPELAMLQAMPGAVRALAMDYLWIRSQELKNQGSFYDAEQRAELICMLEPRFPGVWAFQAWDLSYNISVTRHTPQERWKWVQAGVRLIRDRGVVYNPNALDLYWQIAWTYLDKMGNQTDEMHWAYKRYTAGEFHRVLGAPPISGDPNDTAEWFAPIADAPDRQTDLDEPTRAYLDELREVRIRPDFSLLDAYNTWSNDPAVRMVGQPRAEPAEGDARQQTILRLMTDVNRSLVRGNALAFARRRILIDTYKMRPEWMYHLIERYGPVDFRAVWAHSLYWSSYGLLHATGYEKTSIISLNTCREVLNSLQGLAAFGGVLLTYNPADAGYPQMNNFSQIELIAKTHEEYIWMNQFLAGINDGKTYRSFIDAHINFLEDGMKNLWLSGRTTEAEKYLTFIHDTYRQDDPRFSLAINGFLEELWIRRDGVPRPQAMATIIQQAIVRSYMERLQGRLSEADRYLARARWAWDLHNKRAPERTKLPPFANVEASVAVDFLMRAGLPVLAAGQLFEQLPMNVRANIYDNLMRAMSYQGSTEGLSENELKAHFPEPAGLQEIRKRRAEANEARRVGQPARPN